MAIVIEPSNLRKPSTVAVAGLCVGDEVVVVPVAWIPATKSLAGRRGKLLVLDRARTIAGVRLDGVMHAMPASCLRRSDAMVVSPLASAGGGTTDVRRDGEFAA